MKKSTRRKLLRTIVLIIAAASLVAASILQIASPMPFTDVSAGHWAYENIATMSQGNLIKGYGDGRFGPDDQFNIDQMAQMICNVRGYDTVGNPATDGCAGDTSYWAYGAVEFCIDAGWLPKQGREINAETYAVPCTRELAIYMIVKGLGYNPEVNDPFRADREYLTWKDVPDFASCTVEYMDAIDLAYQLELVEGVDASHRFNPKGKMTRAEAATMLLNAGWTEGNPIPELGEAPTTEELYERIQKLGGWDEHKDPMYDGRFYLTNADKENSGIIKVSLMGDEKVLTIQLDEDNRHTDNPDWYTGSAYSYAGRLRLKEILQAVYPDQRDFDHAWEAVKQVFLREATNGSFGLWIGHRYVRGGTYGPGRYGMSISIYAPNNVDPYCASAPITGQLQPYRFLGKTAEEAYVGFEFDKW